MNRKVEIEESWGNVSPERVNSEIPRGENRN